jgi:5-methylcytosine-specific restriction endonuclease McrA
MNRWGIPGWLEDEVIARDKNCVYCGVKMLEKIPPGDCRRMVGTWEHIINDASIVTRENIARCCSACNSSKGTKALHD